MFSRNAGDNAAALRALAAELTVPAVEAARAAATAPLVARPRLDAARRRPRPRAAWTDFESALRRDPRDVRALEGLVRAGAAAGRGAETVALLRELAAPADHIGGAAGPVALPGLDRRGPRGGRAGVRGRRTAPLRCRRSGTAGLDPVRCRGQGPAAAGGLPVARDCADRGRDALLLRDAPLPRRAHQRGHRRGPAAGGQQSRATPAVTTCSAPPWPPPAAAKPPATPFSPRSRSSRVIPPPTPISGCSSSRPATAPPACSGWPRR